MKSKFSSLNSKELALFKKLNSPQRVQDYLDSLKINFEPEGDTCSSPRGVIDRKSAHCIEAALFAFTVLNFQKQPAFLLDLKANNQDYDHVVCLFKQNGLWGAISKSNHPALRYRDPVYKSVRELAMSYFHEYLNNDGVKTLRSFSVPYSLTKYGSKWITSEDDVWEIANDLDEVKHFPILPKNFKPRKVSHFEKTASNIAEWSEGSK